MRCSHRRSAPNGRRSAVGNHVVQTIVFCLGDQFSVVKGAVEIEKPQLFCDIPFMLDRAVAGHTVHLLDVFSLGWYFEIYASSTVVRSSLQLSFFLLYLL